MASPDFNALRDLHNSANNLLHSPIIRKSLFDDRDEKWLDQVSEASLRMLDVCSISKDVLLLVKQHLHDLQLTLRRATHESNTSKKIAAYNNYRKKLQKETLKCLNSLKAVKSHDHNSFPKDNNLMVVVDVLREVRVTAVFVVESLLSLVSIPWFERRSSKGSFVSMFMRSREECCEGFDEMAVQSANKRLEAVEIAVEDLEDELECMFRRLIETRVSLLNILTS